MLRRQHYVSVFRRYGDLFVFACFGFLLLIIKGKVEAQGVSEIELVWSAPDECPSAGWITSEVERLIGRSMDILTKPQLRVIAEIRQLDSNGLKWELELQTYENDTRGQRRIVADDCQSLAEAVSLIIALYIDPHRIPSTVEIPAEVKESITDHAFEQPSELTPHELEEGSDEKSDEESDEESREESDEESDSNSEVGNNLLNPSEDGVGIGPFEAIIGLDVIGDIGTLPGFGTGCGLIAGMLIGPLVLMVSGDYWFRSEEKVDGYSDISGTLGLVTVTASTCYRVLIGRYGVAPCAHIEVGSMYGEGNVSASQRGSALWIASSVGIRALWQLFPLIEAAFEIGAAVPFLHHEFIVRVEDQDKPWVVHQPAIVALRILLGLELHFKL